MTLQNKLRTIGAAHGALNCRCYHYFHTSKQTPYMIWQEDGGTNLWADNRPVAQMVSGTTDLFTKTEYDPLTEDIQKMLTGLGASWVLNSVQYEEDTGLIHYEWRWSI